MDGEKEYQLSVKMLDDLIDQVGEDELHPLALMMDVSVGSDRELRKRKCSGDGFEKLKR